MPRRAISAIPLSHGSGDCAIAALAAICAVEYPTVVATAARIYPRWRPSEGLDVRKIQRLARVLGRPLAWRRTFDPHHTTGLVVVDGHVAVLAAGEVRDTDGTLTVHPVDSWLKRHAPSGDMGVLVPRVSGRSARPRDSARRTRDSAG